MGALKKGHLYFVQSHSLNALGAITGDFNIITLCKESTNKLVEVTFLAADSEVDCAPQDATQIIKREETKSWEVLHNRSTEISVKDLPLYIGWPFKTDLFIKLLKG